ncbi:MULTISPECIES: hypothetical protein [unclassified Nostoc]|nr:hypothetical protein [Nostoc sp. JL23]MBN3875032.1 hypothetical protein [Nostoc sp. JL23]
MSNTQASSSPGHIYRTLVNQFWILDWRSRSLSERLLDLFRPRRDIN